MNKLRNNNILEICLTTIFLGLLIYSAYSLWYIFGGKPDDFNVQLYNVISGLCLGWLFQIFIKALFKSASRLPRLIAFVSGNALFHALIWGINATTNVVHNEEYLLNEDVVVNTFTIVFALSAVLLLIGFILKAKTKHKVLNVIFALIYFIVSFGGAFVINIENIKEQKYKESIQFDTISAEEAKLTKAEIEFSQSWFKENLLGKGKYPFTFKVDGEAFNPADWSVSITATADKDAPYQGGKTSNILLTHKSNALKVNVEATLFESNATCQWIVYIENTGTESSGVISDFYALDSALATNSAELYYSIGSDTAASDFTLMKEKLGSKAQHFSGVDGKPTESYLPYFNVCGESIDFVLGIGWTGQWAADISENDGNTHISVKQEHFNAYLLPGESVRSPLVSISFYDNDNALKGFNLFRKWIMDSVYPENVKKSSYTVLEVAGPTHTRTSDEIIEILDGIDDSIYKQTDAFWMDAGWYSYNEGWYDGVGNWTVDTKRYDNGISELSNYAKEKGLGHTLWYEPERIYPGTNFHNIGAKNPQWLIEVSGEENIMWNLANEDAFKYYCDYLLKSMKENGVTIYRQDFNFAPYKYWQTADTEYYGGRTGICENHYVTNLYRYLDYLTESIDGLIIDNCASGGKRLDLEMAYRSIAFWRSDYNCSYHPDLFDATQSHTYGISFWLPITGSAIYMQDEYAVRSDIMPLLLMDFGAHTHPDFSFYSEQRGLMGGNYYPLEFGSYDSNKMHAMEFISDDSLSGTALIYKRAKVNDTEYTVKLNGLSEDKVYKVYDVDNPEKIYSLSGKDLMCDGITLPLPEGQKAIILMFSAA
ncbi:MAG: alpha-galactosidase [Clostridia bacterium]|nr:alpha-galactosidase [Clostridia bacterium]